MQRTNPASSEMVSSSFIIQYLYTPCNPGVSDTVNIPIQQKRKLCPQ